MKDSAFILASASPRRRQLLSEAGYRFRVVSSCANEWEDPAADPQELVLENASRKAAAVATLHPGEIVLAADTTVALDGTVYSKPADERQAVEFLESLSGRTHQVYTGVVIVAADGCRLHCVERSDVTFRALSEAAIRDYIATVPVLDKAGAYAIQDGGERIVERYEGSLSNIIGLPMEAVAGLFRQLHSQCCQ